MKYALAACAVSLSSISALPAASLDGDVEWSGVSHIGWQDRLPLCPRVNEAFTITFQTWRNDVEAARVRLTDGGEEWIDAAILRQRGPYDIWTASIPATLTTTPGYVLELRDGSDIDFLGADGMRDELVDASPYAFDFETLEHAPVGATPVAGGTVFKVWAPDASAARVRGDFNGWSTADPMTRVGEHFIAFVAGADPGDEYKYFFNNGDWDPDPRARRLNPTDNNNSIIVDPLSYEWQRDFDPPAFEEMVIYQLHVGSFAGRNDPFGPAPNPSGYRDVGDRADHLAELGVNAVMLNPINEFPGDFSGGYNPISAFAIEWRLGTPDDLKYMIDELHARGIAVILDIVWNHVSYSDNFLWDYAGSQHYFDSPPVDTPWGAQADFDRQGVRDYYLDSIVLMLDEFRMDGFRMDATGFMNIFPQDGSGWSLMQAFNDLIDNRFADKIAIAEQLPDDAWVTRPTAFGGAGFDAQYYDRFTDDLRGEIFDAAFGDPEMWKIRDIINGGGVDLSNGKVVNYFELHDEAWDLSGGQRAVVTIDTSAPHNDEYARGRTTLAQGLVLTAPGIPAFLHGTEWLESEPFETKIDWSKKTSNAGVFALYRDLIALRTDAAAFRADSPHTQVHINDALNIIAFERFTFGGASYVVVANFANDDRGDYRIGVPRSGTWTEVVNSQATTYGGSGFVNPTPLSSEPIAYDGFAQSISLNVPRMGLVVLRHGEIAAPCPDVDGSGVVDFDDLNAVLDAWGGQSMSGDANGDGAVNFDDLNLVLASWGDAC